MKPISEQDIDALISGPGQVDPPARLLGVVLNRIDAEKRRTARWHLAVSAGAGLVSLAALIPAVQYLARDLNSSVFGRYLSLLLSDGRYLASFWSEYALSLVESLPLVSLAAVLAACLALLASFKFSAKYLSQLRPGAALVS